MLEHPHALMQKATGWILREAGKKDAPRLVRFLEDNAGRIPAITLSYAVEKFDVAERTRLRILRKEAQGRRRP